MDTNDRQAHGAEADRHVERVADVSDDVVSLQPLLKTLWLYRQVIGLAVTGTMTLLVIAMSMAYLRQPVERLGTLEFRLLFEGAHEGEYPNGTPFSSSELVAPSVLSEVFEMNELGRYRSYDDFSSSIFILQSNPELELLSYEYRARLSASGLEAVDRLRLEEEFRTRADGLAADGRFFLNLQQDQRGLQIPPSLMNKVLGDTLATWARQAGEQRGALEYDIEVYSSNILRRNLLETEDYITAIDILRTQVRRIIGSVDEVATLPGAAVMRIGEKRVSLAEIRAELNDVLQFRLQPLIGMILETGLSRDPLFLSLYASNRLFQIELQREEARNDVNSVRRRYAITCFRRGPWSSLVETRVQTEDASDGRRVRMRRPSSHSSRTRFSIACWKYPT